MFFDLGFGGIGLPSTIFNQVISDLSNLGCYCGNSYTGGGGNYYPICTGSCGGSLPFFTISVSSNSIYIPNQVYLSTYGGYTILAFVQITTSSFSNAFTVTSGYGSSIILGNTFLQYYLPVFDFTNYNSPTITLYYQSENGLGALGAILGGIAAIIVGSILCCVIACICCCCCIARRNTRYVPPMNEAILVKNNGVQMTTFGQPIVQTNPYTQPMGFNNQPQPMNFNHQQHHHHQNNHVMVNNRVGQFQQPTVSYNTPTQAMNF